MPSETEFQGLPVVTLDGPSGSGKSTLARRLAERLGWHYLDSGAWYRALTWACLEAGVELRDEEAVLQLLSTIRIESYLDGGVGLAGTRLGDELRNDRIDRHVSDVADHGAVRDALNASMRLLLEAPEVKGLVADGRDAGTIIFPDALLQVFVQVPAEVRAQRRHLQNLERGMDSDLPGLTTALIERDRRDAARGDAAPRITARSRILENHQITVEEAIGSLLAWTRERLP